MTKMTEVTAEWTARLRDVGDDNGLLDMNSDDIGLIKVIKCGLNRCHMSIY